LWFDFFLTRPYESFAISRSADIQTTVLLLVVAVGVGELAARDRQHRTDSTSGSEGLAAVQSVSELLAGGAAAKAVIDAVREASSAPAPGVLHFDPRRDPSRCPSSSVRVCQLCRVPMDAADQGLPPSRSPSRYGPAGSCWAAMCSRALPCPFHRRAPLGHGVGVGRPGGLAILRSEPDNGPSPLRRCYRQDLSGHPAAQFDEDFVPTSSSSRSQRFDHGRSPT